MYADRSEGYIADRSEGYIAHLTELTDRSPWYWEFDEHGRTVDVIVVFGVVVFCYNSVVKL